MSAERKRHESRAEDSLAIAAFEAALDLVYVDESLDALRIWVNEFVRRPRELEAAVSAGANHLRGSGPVEIVPRLLLLAAIRRDLHDKDRKQLRSAAKRVISTDLARREQDWNEYTQAYVRALVFLILGEVWAERDELGRCMRYSGDVPETARTFAILESANVDLVHRYFAEEAAEWVGSDRERPPGSTFEERPFLKFSEPFIRDYIKLNIQPKYLTETGIWSQDRPMTDRGESAQNKAGRQSKRAEPTGIPGESNPNQPIGASSPETLTVNFDEVALGSIAARVEEAPSSKQEALKSLTRTYAQVEAISPLLAASLPPLPPEEVPDQSSVPGALTLAGPGGLTSKGNPPAKMGHHLITKLSKLQVKYDKEKIPGKIVQPLQDVLNEYHEIKTLGDLGLNKAACKLINKMRKDAKLILKYEETSIRLNVTDSSPNGYFQVLHTYEKNPSVKDASSSEFPPLTLELTTKVGATLRKNGK